MKKKLLITLGCSYTHGMGCYGLNDFDNENLKINIKGPFQYLGKTDNFYTEGWPHKLQKLLNYNHLINLGKGGSSNSFSLKRWIEIFTEKKISDEYDVLVVWMMTHFSRMSLYINSKLYDIGPGNIGMDFTENFYKEYIKIMNRYDPKDRDMALENLYCLKTINHFCQLNGYNFLYVNADVYEGELLETLESPYTLDKNNLNKYYKNISSSSILKQDTDSNMSFCGHPNEKGYTVVADRLFKLISQHYPNYVNNTDQVDFTMEYLGNPKLW